MYIRFGCPECDCPGRIDLPGSSEWQCPRCDHRLRLTDDNGDAALPRCVVCGNAELYKKKDFPHGLGMTILVAACLASTVTYWFYAQWLTWTILIGSALFDGLLYLWVKDAVVCYRCQAHYHHIPPGGTHAPFELTIHERYRQERMRREQTR